MAVERRVIYTFGHSTRSFDEMVAVLRSFNVEAVADVRRFPGSRRHPHFNDDYLAEHLPRNGIAYLPFKHLGGRRPAQPDSINTGWRNASFRGYADFMQSDEFKTALEELMTAARAQIVTTMCAEAVPWRCHRSLISDALLVHGWDVRNITAAGKASPHQLTKFARVEGTRITYPVPEDQRSLFSQGERG
jgi:uncharacterized protein (DUF488 family)